MHPEDNFVSLCFRNVHMHEYYSLSAMKISFNLLLSWLIKCNIFVQKLKGPQSKPFHSNTCSYWQFFAQQRITGCQSISTQMLHSCRWKVGSEEADCEHHFSPYLSKAASWEELLHREKSLAATAISSELEKGYYTFKEETFSVENNPSNSVLLLMYIYDKAFYIQWKNLKIPHIPLNISQTLKLSS